jgi:hypothetical protein
MWPETFQSLYLELQVVGKCLVEVIVGKYLQVVVALLFAGLYLLGQMAVPGADSSEHQSVRWPLGTRYRLMTVMERVP